MAGKNKAFLSSVGPGETEDTFIAFGRHPRPGPYNRVGKPPYPYTRHYSIPPFPFSPTAPASAPPSLPHSSVWTPSLAHRVVSPTSLFSHTSPCPSALFTPSLFLLYPREIMRCQRAETWGTSCPSSVTAMPCSANMPCRNSVWRPEWDLYHDHPDWGSGWAPGRGKG